YQLPGKPRIPLNSQAKFKSQLASNASQLNLSFPTAADLVRKNSSQLRQTKLTVCQKDNKLKYEGFAEPRPKEEFVYVPTPVVAEEPPKKEKAPAGLPSSAMSKPGRDLISLIGRVDFCLKMHKMYPELNAIWNVYGKLIRIIEGKRGERTLLVRNEGSGPILQGIYHDFDGILKSWTPGKCLRYVNSSFYFNLKPFTGCYIHLVGRFIGENRMQTVKIAQVSDIDWDQFMRLENLTTYILMQNNVHK
ncbi:hypothetical protein KR032_007916, partial [Drosophila birchii]